jgi:hypothetical protein
MSTPSREEISPAVKRFNRWQFIEAQSLLKDVAEQTDGSDAAFFAALADIAGGFAKIWHKGGEPHAMVALLTQGYEKLDAFGDSYLGMPLDDFVSALRGCLEEAKRWRRGDTEIFNRDLIPRLEFGIEAE